MSDYEHQRDLNIQANKALLASLGLEKPAAPLQISRTKKSTNATATGNTTRKRKSAFANESNRRKSQRATRPVKRYKDEDFTSDASETESDLYLSNASDDSYGRGKRNKKRVKRSDSDGESTSGDTDGLRRRTVNGRNVQHISSSLKRARNPNVFGHIPGVPVGTWWSTRLACSAAGVHAPTVGGIAGTEKTGCFSVALSGGYEDDVDEGFRFTYTGSGGRDLKGTKSNPKNLRTAPQSSDQQLTRGNMALKVSCDTGKPIRVIRGYKGTLGPKTGYRYDGLYQVMKVWEESGLMGYKVWKYAFKRLDGQPPLDYKAGGPDEDDELNSDTDDSEDENVEDAEDKDTKDEDTKDEDTKDKDTKNEEDIKDKGDIKDGKHHNLSNSESEDKVESINEDTIGQDEAAAQLAREVEAQTESKAKIDPDETEEEKPKPKARGRNPRAKKSNKRK